jgi:hypothetical protein
VTGRDGVVGPSPLASAGAHRLKIAAQATGAGGQVRRILGVAGQAERPLDLGDKPVGGVGGVDPDVTAYVVA